MLLILLQQYVGDGSVLLFVGPVGSCLVAGWLIMLVSNRWWKQTEYFKRCSMSWTRRCWELKIDRSQWWHSQDSQLQTCCLATISLQAVADKHRLPHPGGKSDVSVRGQCFEVIGITRRVLGRTWLSNVYLTGYPMALRCLPASFMHQTAYRYICVKSKMAYACLCISNVVIFTRLINLVNTQAVHIPACHRTRYQLFGMFTYPCGSLRLTWLTSPTLGMIQAGRSYTILAAVKRRVQVVWSDVLIEIVP